MQEERRQILQMLADGHLTVDEAERLIAALSEGEERRKRRNTRMEGGFGDIGRNVGRTIASAVDVALHKTLGRSWDAGVHTGPETRLDGTGVDELFVANDAMGAGSIHLVGCEGPEVVVMCAGALRHSQSRGRLVLRWPGNDLEVSVPPTIRHVRASAPHGSIRAEGVAAELRLDTLNGHLVLTGVRRAIKAKTCAGNVTAEIYVLEADSEITTLAGSIEVCLGSDFSGTVYARAMEGEIEFEEGLGLEPARRAGNVPLTAVLEVGKEPGRATLLLETLAGGIRVRGAS